MDFWGALSGSTAKNAATTAAAEKRDGVNKATDVVNTGYDLARGGIATGGYDARGAINGATNEVASHLTRGYGAAKDAYGTNLANATGALTGGYGQAIDTQKNALADLVSSYSPYAASGTKAQDLYSNFLGLNGTAAQKAAMDAYADPYGQQIEDRTVAALNRQANAGGFIGSGRSSLAASRAVSEGAYGRQMDYMKMLAEQAGRGQVGALQFGQMGLGNASNIAQLYAGQGQNLGQLYGTAAKDIAGLNVGEGTGQANNMAKWGDATANLIAGTADKTANVDLSKTNVLAQLLMGQGNINAEEALARAAANTQGFNNIIGLGTAAAQAMMGMPPTALSNVGKTQTLKNNPTGSYYTQPQMQSMGYAF